MKAGTARTLGFYGLHLVYVPVLIGLLHLLPWVYSLLALQRFERLTTALTLILAGGLYVGMGYGADRLLLRLYGPVPHRRIEEPGPYR
jgi:NADH:ubiquinone oxidoreductase subunit 3 (subunit A)